VTAHFNLRSHKSRYLVDSLHFTHNISRQTFASNFFLCSVFVLICLENIIYKSEFVFTAGTPRSLYKYCININISKYKYKL
jgi:hypothetical protein